MRVLVTGAAGFIGKNLLLHLAERKDIEVVCFTREHSVSDLPTMLKDVQFVFHLAGINRPQNEEEFASGNTSLSQQLANAMLTAGCKAQLVYTSSIQADLDNPYGLSKRAAEDALLALRDHDVPVSIFRLPNVFGKWAKPNYNSAVATFCHNIAHGLPIKINNSEARVSLVYVDDVIAHFLELLDDKRAGQAFEAVQPVYDTSVGELASQLYRFHDSRETMITEQVGTGLVRALYATYLSYVPRENFTYELHKHGDARGVFVEMLKTPNSGQFSYFTAHPGITRGGHYHHTKTEKFLVIKGKAIFKFRHMQTGEFYQLETEGEHPEVVETMPGWTHDITNVGKDEMIVMLWANEIFDRDKPDTYACPLSPAASE